MRPLTKKQSDFINLFIKNGSKVQSYLQAYNCKNKSIARQKAVTVFNLPHVKKAYQKLKAKTIKHSEQTLKRDVNHVIKRLWNISELNVFDLLDGNNKLKKKIPVGMGQHIQRIKLDRHGNITDVVIPCRLTALNMIMKHFGGYETLQTDNTQINYNIDMLDDNQLTALLEVLDSTK